MYGLGLSQENWPGSTKSALPELFSKNLASFNEVSVLNEEHLPAFVNFSYTG